MYSIVACRGCLLRYRRQQLHGKQPAEQGPVWKGERKAVREQSSHVCYFEPQELARNWRCLVLLALLCRLYYCWTPICARWRKCCSTVQGYSRTMCRARRAATPRDTCARTSIWNDEARRRTGVCNTTWASICLPAGTMHGFTWPGPTRDWALPLPWLRFLLRWSW